MTKQDKRIIKSIFDVLREQNTLHFLMAIKAISGVDTFEDSLKKAKYIDAETENLNSQIQEWINQE